MESAADGPVLAVDVGGTQIRTALVTPDRTARARRCEPTRDVEGVDGRTRIEPAALGPDVSLIGALPTVTERIGDPRFAGSHRPQMAAAQQGVPRL